MKVTLHPSKIGGSIRVPPSKSMAHRILICAALAGGFSRVENVAYSADITATIGALTALGANLKATGSSVSVEGAPKDLSSASTSGKNTINCNESGSTLRLLIPLFALTGRNITFTGTAKLFQRPLSAYEEIFAQQGLLFAPQEASLTVCGRLAPGNYTLRGDVSSQFISGLLFALPLLDKDSTINILPPVESRSYIELTRTAQEMFGVHSTWADEHTLHVPGGQAYTPGRHTVEGDWSQGAVAAVLGALAGSVDIEGLSPNSVQGDRVIVDILRRCGANLEWFGNVLWARGDKTLLKAAGEIDISDCPDLGPILCTLALFCEGNTSLVGAGRLRIKESDRIDSVQAEFNKLNARITSTQNSMTIQGGQPLQGGKTVMAHNDHRVVMALSTAAMCAGISLTIEGADAINKSWPSFFSDIAQLGAGVTIE